MERIPRAAPAPRVATNARASRRVLTETIVLLALVTAAPLLPPGLRTLLALVPLVYFFVERHVRHRAWGEVGFRPRALPRDLAANWLPAVLVAVVIQFVVVWAAARWEPGYLDHVIARLPFQLDQAPRLIPLILVATLGEEITFRALFQERLGWFVPVPVAVGVTSLAFGLAHWAKGDPFIVAIDIGLVVVDSVLYGIIYARTRNVFASWVPHFLADLFALGFVLMR